VKNPMAASIELHIEELVLHGFAPADRYLIGGALERELARLLAARENLDGLAVRAGPERLDAGEFARAPGPEQTGAQVARLVFASMSR
jgi:hypothetical protein